jgi:hypothetical protein
MSHRLKSVLLKTFILKPFPHSEYLRNRKQKMLHYAVGGIFGVDALLMSICLSYSISFAQHKGNKMYKQNKNMYSSLLL